MIQFILKNRLMVLIATALLTAVGLISWSRLPIDAFPDASNQQVMILTEAAGLGPLDVEQQLTFPIETVMGGLPHLRMVRSTSKSALSQVVVVFEDHVDTYFARQLVFERLQLAKEQLPPGVEPEMGPISTGLGEVFQYTLKSKKHSLSELRTIQDWIVAPRLRTISGVNEVNSFGGKVRQIEVRVDSDRLLKYRMTLSDVVSALEENNANAGGSFIIQDWEQENIRNVGLVGSISDIENIVLNAEDGTPITIHDIADVVESHMTRMGGVTENGNGEVVAGMVIMLKGENSRDVVERVKKNLPVIEQMLPDGVTLEPFYDRTELVSAVVSTVANALMQGGVLVVIVLFLLIGNLRSAITAALSLPITALLAFIFMDVGQLTANLMTLGGLAIAIGMVVDGAIVVTENVTRKLRENPGDDKRQTILYAVRQVARPIVFSILIIVLVFVPLFTLEGMEGKMFKPLALTMILAMLGSLIAALTIIPVILSYLMKSGQNMSELRFVTLMRRGYLTLLRNALNHRKVLLALVLIFFVAAISTVRLLGTEFLPELDEGAIAINVVRLPNASLDGSIRTAGYMEKKLLTFPEVKHVVSKTGRAEISEDPMGPEQTDLLIMLHPEIEWTTGRSKPQLVAAIQKELGKIPGIRLAFSQPIALRVNELISGVKSDLAVKLFGEDIELLKKTADNIATTLRGIDGAEDVSVEQVAGFSQLEIIPDRRQMARYKLKMSDLNELVETAIGGKVATELVEGQKRFGIKVRFPRENRNSTDAIEKLLLLTESGARVPLGRIAHIERSEGPAQISRENSMRRVVVEANIRGRDLGGFVTDARGMLKSITDKLPPGYWLEYGGTFESQQRAMKRLSIVVPISVLVIFLMLISALGSMKSATLVLVNLPFALVGGILSMFILHINLNVPSTVGFIALFGVAVQNGTVLVTFINELRANGKNTRDAIVEACGLRFTALLMTASTTVLGLLPMVYAVGPGAEVQRPLAVVVIGGLITATLLTLFVLPSLYLMFAPKVNAPGQAGAY
jgi:heavy metal efflux system protein